MSELIKELGKMLGFFKGLFENEKDRNMKKLLLELVVMIDDRLNKILDTDKIKIGTPFFNTVIDRIKETKNIVNEYKQKTKTYNDLLEHVIKVSNEVEGLFFGLETVSIPTAEEQQINK